MKTRFKSLFTALLATAIVAPAAQAAGKYPSRPIRVVVMFPAGGSADIVGRMVAQKAGDLSGFNFVVENRPGAGGNLALDAVATAAPDATRWFSPRRASPSIPACTPRFPTSSPISRRSRWSARRR